MVLGRGFPAVSGSKKLSPEDNKAVAPNKIIGRFTLISAKSATVVAKTPPILAIREQEPKLAFLQMKLHFMFFLKIHNHVELISKYLPNTSRK